MIRKSIVLCILPALVVLDSDFTTAQDRTAKDTKREGDRLAIAKLTRAMIEAFDKRDTAATAAHSE